VIGVLGQAFPETQCSVSACAGVALFPTHGMDFKALIEQADHALYQAKRAGKNRVFLAASFT
jgi:diguanylate cyclase (GGDEF)-like protein